MKIKIFDESHEKDLEDDIKKFIENDNPDIIDIKYCVSTSMTSEDQIYCFRAKWGYKSQSNYSLRCGNE